MFPDAPDLCGDSVDQDCNGGDGDDSSGSPWYPDTDGDGFGDATVAPTVDCGDLSLTGDYTGPALALDCDDTEAFVSPDATETCNLTDDDCNGLVDDAVGTPYPWFVDRDQDGYGDALSEVDAVCAPGPDWLATGEDCDDDDGGVHPDAPEACNGVDDDCDDALDADDPDVVDALLLWDDVDRDGFGGCRGEACFPIPVCPEDRAGEVDNHDDCDDADPTRHPGVAERFGNGLDDDCDGQQPEVPHPTVPPVGCASGGTSVGVCGLGLALVGLRRRQRR